MTLRDEARLERERVIALLTACHCEYPITRYRNVSGHDGACPAHALWKQQNNLTTTTIKDS